MARYGVQYIKHHVSGLVIDDVVNNLHFETTQVAAVPATALALAGAIAAAHYDATGGGQFLETYIGSGISRVNPPTIKVYDDSAPGSPLAEATQLAMRAANGGGYNLPREVALCLSFRAEYQNALEQGPDDADPDFAPERPRSRRRGRIFEGPWTTQTVQLGDSPRPINNIMLSLLDYGSKLFAIRNNAAFLGLGLEWVVLSKETVGGPTTKPVRFAYVDNEWDTQRRRGLKATTRESAAFVP